MQRISIPHDLDLSLIQAAMAARNSKTIGNVLVVTDDIEGAVRAEEHAALLAFPDFDEYDYPPVFIWAASGQCAMEVTWRPVLYTTTLISGTPDFDYMLTVGAIFVSSEVDIDKVVFAIYLIGAAWAEFAGVSYRHVDRWEQDLIDQDYADDWDDMFLNDWCSTTGWWEPQQSPPPGDMEGRLSIIDFGSLSIPLHSTLIIED